MSIRVVVTGMGVICPVGLDRDATWQAMLEGRSGIDHISLFDAEGFEVRIAGEVRGFEPTLYMDRKRATRMDRFAQLACAASLQAKAQAGLDMAKTDPARVAVLIGSGVGGIMTLSEQYDVLKQKGPNRVSPFLIPMMLTDLAAGNVSMMIGAKGPNFSPVSACATGADAIGEAFEMIRRGTVDVAFAGGTEAAICPIAVAGFNSCMALSKLNDDPKKASRPFDAKRDGFVLGEGSGVLLIESLEHADARGAWPIAELVGYAATSDAHHVTQPAPGGTGAAHAMRLALEQARLTPQDIDYVNAHGTSTPLNDKLETAAMKAAFGEHAPKVPISSTKSMTGHLLGAAGGVEAAVSVMAIERSAIPPTINLEHPDPECDLDYVPNKARTGRVRTAMSNSMGFGGHNTCLIFKEIEG
ncbi:MAG: beta-ketoacyl-ACP synthase II [Chloroflexi bacterium]|nr:beta-ketoacyl-ACP synthase II [Chloroflexota bacterium]